MRGDDFDLAGLDILWRSHTGDTAKMVAMAVGEYHRDNRPVAERLVGQRQPGFCRSGRGKGVDNDPAGLAGDQGHLRQIIAANLVDAGHDLEQAVDAVELALPPERGIDGVGCVALQKFELARIPCDRAVLVENLVLFNTGEKTAIGIFEITLVGNRQVGRDSGIGGPGGFGCHALRRSGLDRDRHHQGNQ